MDQKHELLNQLIASTEALIREDPERALGGEGENMLAGIVTIMLETFPAKELVTHLLAQRAGIDICSDGGKEIIPGIVVTILETIPAKELVARLLARNASVSIEQISSFEVLNIPICELELTVRTENCLKSKNICFIGELVQWTDVEIMKIPNMGKRPLNEIKEALGRHNLRLGMSPDWTPPRSR